MLMSSHVYCLYLLAVKPYQTAGYNAYVLSYEICYAVATIALFIFSDATPKVKSKNDAAVWLVVAMICLLISNVVMFMYVMT
jgi:uncharacterized BrkB/YihY/UPF0761 family membrane protein